MQANAVSDFDDVAERQGMGIFQVADEVKFIGIEIDVAGNRMKSAGR